MSTERKPVAGFVYILKPAGHNVYKIGCTTNLDRRIKTIRSKHSFNVEYIATGFYADYTLAETAWHRHFKNKHLIGEWFLLDDSDIELFEAHTS